MSLSVDSILDGLQEEVIALVRNLGKQQTHVDDKDKALEEARAEADRDRKALQREREALEVAREAAQESHKAETALLARLVQIEAELESRKRAQSEAEEAHLQEWNFLEVDLSARMEAKDKELEAMRMEVEDAREEVQRLQREAQGTMSRVEHRVEIADLRKQYEAKIKGLEAKLTGQQQRLNAQQEQLNRIQMQKTTATLTAAAANVRRETPVNKATISTPSLSNNSATRKKPELLIQKTNAASTPDTSILGKRKRVTFDLDKQPDSPTPSPSAAHPKRSTAASGGGGVRKSLGALLSIKPLPPTLFGGLVRRSPNTGESGKRKLFNVTEEEQKEF